MKRAWTPYSGQDGPCSPGRVLLSEFLELFYECHWSGDASDIRAACDEPDSEAADVLDSTVDFLGSLVADGTIAAVLRPIGGGAPLPMGKGLWEIDDYDGRFRSSALSLDDWSNPAATPTHWIFVSERDVDKFLDSWRANTFNEPAPFDETESVERAVPNVAQVDEGSAQQSTIVLRLPAVMARTGLSRSTIYERIAAGVFPAQVRLGVRAAGWYQHEVDAWVRSRRQSPGLGL